MEERNHRKSEEEVREEKPKGKEGAKGKIWRRK